MPVRAEMQAAGAKSGGLNRWKVTLICFNSWLRVSIFGWLFFGIPP